MSVQASHEVMGYQAMAEFDSVQGHADPDLARRRGVSPDRPTLLTSGGSRVAC